MPSVNLRAEERDDLMQRLRAARKRASDRQTGDLHTGRKAHVPLTAVEANELLRALTAQDAYRELRRSHLQAKRIYEQKGDGAWREVFRELGIKSKRKVRAASIPDRRVAWFYERLVLGKGPVRPLREIGDYPDFYMEGEDVVLSGRTWMAPMEPDEALQAVQEQFGFKSRDAALERLEHLRTKQRRSGKLRVGMLPRDIPLPERNPSRRGKAKRSPNPP